MGGRHSKPHHHTKRCSGHPQAGPPLPAFVLIDWGAAFLEARMAEGGTTPAPAPDPNHDALSASSPALAQAFRPLVDARRLIALAEEGAPPPPTPTSSLAAALPPFPPLNVRGRLVLFPADLSVMNHRLHRLFHRRGYRPIVGPRELQAHATARALGRFGRRLTRRHHHYRRGHQRPVGVVVVVAGDGGLERHPAFAAALRGLLHQGFALEAWVWGGSPGGAAAAAAAAQEQLYQRLAVEFPPTPGGGGVRLRGLDEHRGRLRYGGAGLVGRGGLDGLVASTLHSVAAAVLGAGAGAFMASPSAPPAPPVQQPPPQQQQAPAVPVAVPLAVGVGDGGERALLEGKVLTVESSDEDEDDDGRAGGAGARRQTVGGGEEEEEEELPEYLLDPLTFEPLEEPVLAPSGYTFSRAVIMDQIRRRGTDPFTNAPLAEADLRPNRALAEAVEVFRAQRQGRKGGGGGGAGAGGSGSA